MHKRPFSQRARRLWLLLARALSGVGEASFQAIAPPFLDDAASAGNKGTLLAVFYCAIPVGTALGYIYGGLMEKYASWRTGFLVLAAVMLPATIACFFGFLVLAAVMLPATIACFFVTNTLETSQPKEGKDFAQKGPSVVSQAVSLFRNKVWLATALGYAAWTFTIGAFAVWGPTYIHKVVALQVYLECGSTLLSWDHPGNP
ncbi:major facilitator superfamily domain-containing protein [Baffinella frigidus]|nr:major facilitator superfamily domain-containing protein [Cryptophyta sp. CCMP2293]